MVAGLWLFERSGYVPDLLGVSEPAYETTSS